MTPEERAQVLENSDHAAWDEDFRIALIAEFRQAIAQERERCARIAESYGIGEGIAYKNLPRACEDIAAAIRADEGK